MDFLVGRCEIESDDVFHKRKIRTVGLNFYSWRRLAILDLRFIGYFGMPAQYAVLDLYPINLV
jgi:hypothetical protein